jgi:putative ABC transport system permease protein
MTKRRDSAWAFLKRPRVEEEVDTELAFHVDMTIETLVANGMTPEAARAEAVRRFGDIAVVNAECRRFGRQRDRGRSRGEYFEEIKQDITFALRQLARARAFAATAIVTLALGIGATAAVFSAVYAVVLKPLPFADADRVVQVLPMRRGAVSDIVSGGELSAIRARRDAFVRVAGIRRGAGFTITDAETPEVLNGMMVTAEYFPLLGISPQLGRGFLESDDVPGAPRVVLVSHRLWKNRFGGDTALVGRVLRLEDEPATVIGVMPASLDALGTENDVWGPLRLSAEQLRSSSGRWLAVVARLAPNVTVTAASDAARAAILAEASRTPGQSQEVGATVRRYVDVFLGNSRERLFVLLGAVGFVLLIACVNVANLLLGRGTVRARELAIRAALGAGRARLTRQMLAESLVLALGSAVVGVFVAYALIKGLVALGPEDVPRLDQASVNGVVLAFTFIVAVATSIVIGLVPAVRTSSPMLQSALRDGGRGAGMGARRERARALLVASEVALAMTLLTGAGLLIRTAISLQRVDPGFNPSHVATSRVLLPRARYQDAAHISRTFEQILEAASRVPGVQQAGLVSVVPLSESHLSTSVAPEGRTVTADERIAADMRYASPRYFSTMGIPLLDGRDFANADNGSAPAVAVISASLARKVWPGERPVGKRIEVMRTLMTVVGVAGDVHDEALNVPVTPTLYMPFAQTPAGMWAVTAQSLVLVARTVPPPETMTRALRHAVTTVDPSLPLADSRTMEQAVARSVATARFNTLLLSTLGAIALVLASVGVYGVVAYFVSQRTREIGVRMALGATPRDIWQLVLTRGLAPIVWGALVGGALSLVTMRLLREQLFGVSATDPMTIVSVLLTLLLVALIATFTPARRAMRVTPARALAAE